MKDIRNILIQYWGHAAFRPLQDEIIQSVLDGNDTVALLPTGGGKSICYQVPALAMEGICIVISPLVALMGDQVNSLKKKGIKALKITGGISFSDLNATLDNALHGNYKFLYLSPERLQQEIVQNYIRQLNVNLIAVDEAHCISQWGNDFRPSYRKITVLRELKPLVPVIALTATATSEVLEDTISELRLALPRIFRKSFIRDNLAYKVFEEEDKLYRAEQLLKHNPGSAIVYVRSRKSSVEISSQLQGLGISSTFFHGGLSAKEKADKLQLWLDGKISTMVATNAFGMGIDHPDVRHVIHLQIPESIESYFQETGRGGRDGNYATATLLYNQYDKLYVNQQYVESLAGIQELKKIYRTLCNYFQIPYGEGEFTTHNFNFSLFCQTYGFNSLLTFNALNTLDRLGIIQLSKEFGRKSILQFIVSAEILLGYFERDPTSSVIGKSLLRMYGGIFEMPTAINLDLISSKTGQGLETIIKTLKRMERDGLLDMSLQTTDASLTFLLPREDDKTINVISREVEATNQKKREQVQAILRYIDNTKVCRSVQLVSYFGERNAARCGICSVCDPKSVRISRGQKHEFADHILALLESRDMTSRELAEHLLFPEEQVIQILQLLLDAKRIQLTPNNKFYLK